MKTQKVKGSSKYDADVELLKGMFKSFFNADVELEIGVSMLDSRNMNRIPFIRMLEDGTYSTEKYGPITGHIRIPEDIFLEDATWCESAK